MPVTSCTTRGWQRNPETSRERLKIEPSPVSVLVMLKLLKTLRDGEASYQSQGQAGSSPQSSERRKPLPGQAERCGQMGKPGHYQTMHLPETQHSRCHASPAGWLVKSGRMNRRHVLLFACPTLIMDTSRFFAVHDRHA